MAFTRELHCSFGQLQTGGPFAITENFINAAAPGTPTGATYAMPNPFPTASATATVASISGFSNNYRTPYSQNWNLSLEREIAKNWGMLAGARPLARGSADCARGQDRRRPAA